MLIIYLLSRKPHCMLLCNTIITCTTLVWDILLICNQLSCLLSTIFGRISIFISEVSRCNLQKYHVFACLLARCQQVCLKIWIWSDNFLHVCVNHRNCPQCSWHMWSALPTTSIYVEPVLSFSYLHHHTSSSCFLHLRQAEKNQEF